MEIDWSKISPENFEKFCWHLLEVYQFKNLQWFGKGGKDRSRDIVGNRIFESFPNFIEVHKWIVQCKRYINRAPSVSDIARTIEWAEADPPDYILFIITNVLSPDTRDWINEKQKATRFKIVVMDRPLLESLLLKQFEQLKPYVPLEIQNEVIKYLPREDIYMPVKSRFVESQEQAHMNILRKQAIDPWINLLRGIQEGISVITGGSIVESSSLGSVTVSHDISITLPADPDFKYSDWLLEHLSTGYPENYNNWKKIRDGFTHYLLDVKDFYKIIKRKLINEIQNKTTLSIYDIRGKPPRRYFVPNYLTYIIYSDLKTESSIGKRYFKESLKLESLTDELYNEDTYNISCGAYSSLARGNKLDMEKIINLIINMERNDDFIKQIKKNIKNKCLLNNDLSQFINFLEKISKYIENKGSINGDCEFCKSK